ncbi:flagellar hook-associated protein FlgL [Nocardioides nematodiphilus]|uniref:flagellar hook-associated protein FlgL n=1 Tax=Nocardioides nematodiphilus TaxID=2849669 RepID=UPI001CD99E57|nr:flagellar hook-associated protein FlgL [Nocardioides nematodiphilus]MCA1983193.1 flagellar hook-associated protein FlgL [Nocardioides nematodiphilus]
MISRVTQHMLVGRELSSIGLASTRMAAAQETMTTGRRINRPSDAPADTTVALKARGAIGQNEQYQRNAQDGTAWLSTIDTTLSSTNKLLNRAYVLALQGADSGANGAAAESAIADEIDQIKQSVLGLSNTQYLGRPVFGGTTTNGSAYVLSDPADPASAVVYKGDTGSVNRRVGDGTVVRVDMEGTKVFGDTAGGDSVFDHLQALSDALRANPVDDDGVQSSIAALQKDMSSIGAAQADEGARMKQIDTASGISQDTTLALQKVKSDVEDVDIAEATINMQSMTAAYQAALMAVGKSTQQSLLNFLS